MHLHGMVKSIPLHGANGRLDAFGLHLVIDRQLKQFELGNLDSSLSRRLRLAITPLVPTSS